MNGLEFLDHQPRHGIVPHGDGVELPKQQVDAMPGRQVPQLMDHHGVTFLSIPLVADNDISAPAERGVRFVSGYDQGIAIPLYLSSPTYYHREPCIRPDEPRQCEDHSDDVYPQQDPCPQWRCGLDQSSGQGPDGDIGYGIGECGRGLVMTERYGLGQRHCDGQQIHAQQDDPVQAVLLLPRQQQPIGQIQAGQDYSGLERE